MKGLWKILALALQRLCKSKMIQNIKSRKKRRQEEGLICRPIKAMQSAS